MPKHNVMVQLFIDGQAVWQVTEPVPADLVFKLSDGELTAVASGIKDLLSRILAARTFVESVPPMTQEPEVHYPKTVEVRRHVPNKKHGRY